MPSEKQLYKQQQFLKSKKTRSSLSSVLKALELTQIAAQIRLLKLFLFLHFY